MTLMIYPRNKSDVSQLTTITEALVLPRPMVLNPNHLKVTITDLLALGKSEKNDGFEVLEDGHYDPFPVIATEPPEPVILFSRVPGFQIKKLIASYKKIERWPIFAMVTKTSVTMALSTLFMHLLEDRKKELNFSMKHP